MNPDTALFLGNLWLSAGVIVPAGDWRSAACVCLGAGWCLVAAGMYLRRARAEKRLNKMRWLMGG